jgi:uncharacterized membrane protein
MAFSASKTAGFGLALLAAGNASALGLGEVSGRAVLGQTLRLEIPLLGGEVPAKSCFRLRAPRTDVGNDFASRNGRVDVVGEGKAAKLVVTTTAAVSEPVIGFALAAGCGFELSKDYVLLVGLPSVAPTLSAAPTLPATPVVSAPATPASAAPAEAPAKAAPQHAAADTLRVDSAITLEALAQRKYPLQPKAREKFMRMMREANRAAIPDNAPIAAGTELRQPPGLPQRRFGPYLGEGKAVAPEQKKSPASAAASEAAVAAAPAKAPAAAGKQAKAGKDRLVLAPAAESNEAKLLAEAERLTGVLVEQNKTQEEINANLAKLEASYADLHKQFTDMQARLARVEADRIAEKQAAENSKTSQLIELLIAVLAGGALGGFGLHLFQRRRMPQADMGIDGVDDGESAMPAAPAASASISLPWAKPAVPPWLATTAPAAPVQAAAAEAPPLVVAVAETPVAAPAPIPAPAAAAAAGAETALADAAVADVPEVAPSASMSALDASEPAVVLEPLDFSPPAPAAALETSAPEAAVTAAAAKPEPPQEELSLDFPEIAVPAAAPGDALDFHKS